ncbi:MAG: Ig-like domain-containing protein [Candidatus Hinthialibacter antarcticus]|nr:Ig-like domain-containing protein [Candidatus Hinthialibacter antarcticus]
MKRLSWNFVFVCLVILGASWGAQAAVQYQNDFENPSSELPGEAWPEWVDFGGGTARAVNGRIEWTNGGGNNQWIRLNQALPDTYTFEFDFFHPADVNARFSVWPAVKVDESIFERHNYFLRANTHYFNGADTIPTGGPIDMTEPVGAAPHRLRFEVSGDHVVFLYKDRGEGGWILVDERDFPEFGEGERFIQLGNNHDGGDSGVHYVDNFVLSYTSQNLFNYSNNFNNPSSDLPWEAWPEWIDFGGGTARAVNGRIEWLSGGGNNQWIRLDEELPLNYVMEFDFFHPADVNARFSVWPLVGVDESIFDRHNYFLRANTHYFNGSDTIPTGGPIDITEPLGSPPHRLRFEVTGDHIVFLYKDRGEGGYILVDERDFPAFGDGPRYVQLGNNHDGGDAGVHYVDNFTIRGLADNRAILERSITQEKFEADTAVPVELKVTVTGSIPSMSIIEGIPENWTASNISNGGVLSDGNIYWSFTNQSETVTLTYNAMPPRLIRNRVANFSGSADSGDGEERIAGDTAIEIELPYLYRETIDIDFSGSPVDGKNYPAEYAYGERYTQGMDGVATDAAYTRPGDGTKPAIDTSFTFPQDADFRFANPGAPRDNESYAFDDYRDQDEITFEHGASDTNAGVGGDRISQGDWFRYTFDLGEGQQVLVLNLSVNTWGQGNNCPVDVYVNNKFKGEILATPTDFNAYNFFSVGPFEVSGGVQSIVLAIPGPTVPDSIGRMEVVRVDGIGRVERSLTADGSFAPSTSFDVSLNAESLYGTYTPYIEESVPEGVEVSNISNGGQMVGDRIIWQLDPTTTSTSVTYQVAPPEGLRFLLFDGMADIGLPIADSVKGDGSVFNQLWLFGQSTSDMTDNFDGANLSSEWMIEYGSDPALDVDYEEGVDIHVADGNVSFTADAFGDGARLDEYAAGRRAPMLLRTDIPDGDWRIETELTLVDAFDWANINMGMTVTYNQGDDADISNDEYLFGFYNENIRVELTNVGQFGSLSYHELTDVFDWYDLLDAGDATAKLAVTKRTGELIFSAQLPGRPWQLLGAPLSESRTPTRVGFFSKVWGVDSYVEGQFNYFTLSELEAFTDVVDWALY